MKNFLSYFLSIQLWMSSVTSFVYLLPVSAYSKENVAKKSEELSEKDIKKLRKVSPYRKVVIELVKDIDYLFNKITKVKLEVANDIYKNAKNGGYIATVGNPNQVNTLRHIREDADAIKDRIEKLALSNAVKEKGFNGKDADKPSFIFRHNLLKMKVVNYFLNKVVREYRELFIISKVQETSHDYDLRSINELLPEFKIHRPFFQNFLLAYLNGETKEEKLRKSQSLVKKTKKHTGRRSGRLSNRKKKVKKITEKEKVEKEKKEKNKLLDSIDNLELLTSKNEDDKGAVLLNLRGEKLVDINTEKKRILFNFEFLDKENLHFKVKFGLERPIFDDILTLGKVNTAYTYLESLKWLTVLKVKNEIKKYKTFIPNEDTYIKVPNSCRYENGGHFPDSFNNKPTSEDESDVSIGGYLHENGLALDKFFIKDQLIKTCMEDNNIRDLNFDPEKFCRKKHEKSMLSDPDDDINNDERFNKFIMGKEVRRLYNYHSIGLSGTDFEMIEFLGILPYERYLNAKQARFYLRDDHKKGYEVALNDVTDFNAVMKVKKATIELMYKKMKPEALRTGGMKRRKQFLKDREILKKAFFDAIDVKDLEVVPNEIIFSTPLLYDVMNEYGKTLDWMDVLTKDERSNLKNTLVELPFPNYLGSHLRRSWAFGVLRNTLIDYKYNNKTYLNEKLNLLCELKKRKVKRTSSEMFCNKKREGRYSKKYAYEAVDNIIHVLTKLKNDDSFLPSVNTSLKITGREYFFLKEIWNILKDKSEYMKDLININELDYITTAIQERNPYAMMKISFIKFEKRAQKLVSKKYWNKYGKRLVKRFKKHLGMDKPLVPNFGNEILTKTEKKIVFEAIKSELDEKTSYLFTIPLDDSAIKIRRSAINSKTVDLDLEKNMPTYFDVVHDIISGEYVSKKDFEDTMDKLDLEILPRDEKYLNEVFSTNAFIKSGALRKLQKNRGMSIDEQVNMLEKIQEIDSNVRYEAIKIKDTYYTVNNYLRSVILRALVRKVASEKVEELNQILTKVCDTSGVIKDKSVWKVFGLFGENIDEVRTLYSITKKSQGEMENVFKIKPPKLYEDYGSAMSNEEAGALSDGLYSALWFLGGAAILSSCLLPIVGQMGCITAAWAGFATTGIGFGLQGTAYLKEKNDLELRGKSMRNLLQFYHHGFLDKSTIESLEKGPTAMLLEAAFMIPMVGLVGKSIYIGAKINIAAFKSFTKQGRVLIKNKAKIFSKNKPYRYKKWREESKEIVEDSVSRMKMSHSDYQIIKSLEISGLTKWMPHKEIASYVKDGVKIPFTKDQIRDGWALSFAKQIGHASKLRKKYEKILKKMSKYEKRVNEDKVYQASVRRAEKLNKTKYKDDPRIFKFFKSTPDWKINRAKKFVKHKRGLKRIVRQLKTIEDGDTKAFATWVRKNDLRLVSIINELPAPPMQLIYDLFTQGSFKLNFRTPILANLAQSAVLKRLASSFDTLITESMKREVQAIINKTTSVNLVRAYNPNQDGREGIRMIHRLSGPISDFMGSMEYAIKTTVNMKEKDVLTKAYREYQKKLALNISSFAKKNWNTTKIGQKIKGKLDPQYRFNWEQMRNLTPERVDHLLFEKNLSYGDRALREFLINAIPRNIFFPKKGFKQMSHLAHMQLKHRIDSSTDALGHQLNILKLLLIEKKPLAMDFF